VAVSTWQPVVPELLRKQQAPVGVGRGQGLVVQVVPAPRHVPWSTVQLASVRTEQLTVPVAVVMQHAPVGVAQMSLPQTVFGPRQIPWAAVQLASVRSSHATVPAAFRRQHAPSGSVLMVQVVLVQVVPAGSGTPPAVRHASAPSI
jgi:hypothetical protein